MPTNSRHCEAQERSVYAPSGRNSHDHFGASNTSYLTTTRSINAAASRTDTRGAGVPAQQLQRFDALLRLPENRECFDCGTKQPRWASTNLGIFFCLRCAGIHRSMGTHISKVKSVNMDTWAESMMLVVEHIGNARGRLLYEYNMPPSEHVTSTTETTVVERAIRSKYERKLYYHPRYAELVAQFRKTPMEGLCAGGSTALTSPKSNALPRKTDEPGKAQQQKQPAVLEELWGAPVSSPNTDQHGQPVTQATTVARTNVAELFSAYPTHGIGISYAASGDGSRPSPTVWGKTAESLSSAPLVGANNDSAWFESQPRTVSSVVSPTNGVAHNRTQLPNTLKSATDLPTGHDNTVDLFTGGNASTGCSKDEILSLFRTAPVAGAYGNVSSGDSANTGRHPLAW